jgi:hypothetical protein
VVIRPENVTRPRVLDRLVDLRGKHSIMMVDTSGRARVADLQPAALDLPKHPDDLLCTTSLLHGLYGLQPAERSFKTVRFRGLDDREHT